MLGEGPTSCFTRTRFLFHKLERVLEAVVKVPQQGERIHRCCAADLEMAKMLTFTLCVFYCTHTQTHARAHTHLETESGLPTGHDQALSVSPDLSLPPEPPMDGPRPAQAPEGRRRGGRGGWGLQRR